MAISQRKKSEQAPQKRDEQPLNMESIAWDDLTWINIERPTKREMDYLAQNFPFHPLDLDDCLSRKQRPKIDEYEDYLFFIFHYSMYDKEKRVSTPEQVSAFIGKNYLITVYNGQLKTLSKLFRDCQLDEQSRQDNLQHGSGYLLYRILDRTIDSYFPVLDKILELVEKVEGAVFDENVESAQEIAILRRDIITQRRIMFPVRSIIAEMEKKIKRFSKIDISVYFGDIIDHLNKICETLDEAKEIIEVYKDSDYVLGTERLNRIVRVLTILSAIMLPFLLLTSFYGMNIPLPGSVNEGSFHSFLILTAIMSLLSVSMLYFFRRKRWI